MLCNAAYKPSRFLQNGVRMTIYSALWGKKYWEKTSNSPDLPYKEHIFRGFQDVPLYGLVAIPENPRGTIIATYGITGDLESEWSLRILSRKAYDRGYAVILFDWRAHGKSAELSPTLTSDGLFEGDDFVCIAAGAAAIGCPAKFWFVGYSLGGQLALWGNKAATELKKQTTDIGIQSDDIGGVAAVCPNLDSRRSLAYLVSYPFGRLIEARIAKNLEKLAWKIHKAHPGSLDPEAIKRARSIWGFDHELVIGPLGFPSVESYYDASNALQLLPNILKPTLIIYAEDDPFFLPNIVDELRTACSGNSAIDLLLTKHGGHIGYINSKKGQQQANDPDPWWVWNRIIEWVEMQ
ncbi:MAG: alpha/beta fold hydrolase [Cyanobacteria bacterium J06639_18]